MPNRQASAQSVKPTGKLYISADKIRKRLVVLFSSCDTGKWVWFTYQHFNITKTYSNRIHRYVLTNHARRLRLVSPKRMEALVTTHKPIKI